MLFDTIFAGTLIVIFVRALRWARGQDTREAQAVRKMWDQVRQALKGGS
ncbi:MAG TPA: hypothetical protein VJP78_06545 [Thermoleophilia bacterium]|nr:hypothetical protein [Thermoleophilia bacterium]